MRTRRWILIIALFVAFTALVIYHGWNLLKVNERIKQYVIVKIRPALGGALDINKLNMSLGAVHLKNVRMNTSDFLLNIEDVRIGFSLTSLIKNSFHPQRIPQEFIFIKPHLTLRKNPLKKQQDRATDSSRVEMSNHDFWKKLKNVDFIKRVTVSKGKISYADSTDQDVIQLAHDLNGWFNSKDDDGLSVRLVGKLFRSATYNLLMTANLDAAKERLNLLDVKVKNYEWKEKIPKIIPEYFNIEQGIIDGTIQFVNNDSSGNGLDIQGNLSINNGKFQISNHHVYFDDINIDVKIDSLNCVIENSSFVFNGSQMEVEGKINNFLSPQLDLTLKSDQFDLGKNLATMVPKSKIMLTGNSSVLLKVTNTLYKPIITGNMQSSAVILNGKTFQQVKANISFINSIFKINKLSAGLDGIKLLGSGDIDFSGEKDSVSFAISSQGEIFPALLKLPFRSLEGDFSKLYIQGNGNLTNISGLVDFQLTPSKYADTTFHFKGNYHFRDKELSLQLNSPTHPFMGEISVSFSGKRPYYSLRFTDIHHVFYNLPEFKFIRKIFNYKTSLIELFGESGNWRISGRYAWNGNSNRTAIMTGRIRSRQDKMKIDATVNIHSGGAKFYSILNLVKTPGSWQFKKLDIENIVQCKGEVFTQGDKAIEAKIVFPDAILPDVEKLLLTGNKSIDQGKLNGRIDVSGTIANPELNGNLNLTEVVFNQIGFYDASMFFQLQNHAFKLNEFVFSRNELPVFNCDGTYALNSDDLNFRFSGQDIDLNMFMKTLFNKPGMLRGKGSSNLQLRGSLNRPKLYGEVEIDDGMLGPFSFSRVLLDLGNSQPADTSNIEAGSNSVEDNGAVLRRILITRVGQFEMQGSGVIPYSSQNPMNIELKGKGNILSILPELTGFFTETKSNGNWSVKFSGRPGNLTIAGGDLSITDGYLGLRSVAQKINDINMNMELEQDGFLNVTFISGAIRGKPFTFRNFRPDSTIPDSTMESFSIPEFGLDFGIFTLETSPKGIPLHIPGLMRKRETGYLSFNGKSVGEQFYLAGPLERPIVRGNVQLHNVNFTFPFIKKKPADTTKSDAVVRVLKQINWNVTAHAGKDMHYQREIPSGVDNVYVDLIVDAGVGGLEFKGVINEKKFGVRGKLESSHGNVEYLDLDFQVIKGGAEFDKSTLLPIVYGEARTTVIDSTGYPYYVYLTLLTVDEETGHRLKRGRVGEVAFELSADNPNLGYTEGELLASLGYSVSNIPKIATDLIGISTDNLLFRPLFRPFERRLERTLGLDMVRFSSRFTRNLIEMNLRDEKNFQYNSRLFLLRSTKLMVGKYIADRFLLLYTGQLEAGMDYRYQQEGFGLRHTLGLEYRINPSLLLQMEYDYDSLLLWQKEDKKFMLRHSFPF